MLHAVDDDDDEEWRNGMVVEADADWRNFVESFYFYYTAPFFTLPATILQ